MLLEYYTRVGASGQGGLTHVPEGICGAVGGPSQRLQEVRNMFKVVSLNFEISFEFCSVFHNRSMFVIEYKRF